MDNCVLKPNMLVIRDRFKTNFINFTPKFIFAFTNQCFPFLTSIGPFTKSFKSVL